jgi:peptidoglycan/LPS O-acetylase OafA/YrhL
MTNQTQQNLHRHNNFDLIRLAAALMVIFAHAYLTTGQLKNEPLSKALGFIDFGALGVSIFFTISGYLVTKSWRRQPTPGRFVWARVLRIFPGLLTCALFLVFIIGPLNTSLPLRQYFTNSACYDYLWRTFTLHNPASGLPGVFLTNPSKGDVDGSLWTLPAEVLFYGFLLLLGVVGLAWKRNFKTILMAIPLLLGVGLFFYGINFSAVIMLYLYGWGWSFFLGMLFCLVDVKTKINIPVLVLMLVICGLLFHFRVSFFRVFFDATLAYGIFVVAYHPKLFVKAAANRGDFSYGLYIYAFPIQQTVVAKLHTVRPLSNFIIALAITLPIAILSWYLVEQPMLSLKNLGLKRQVAKT